MARAARTGLAGLPARRATRLFPPGIAARFRELKPLAEVEVCHNSSEALRRCIQDPLVVVTGSLHFIGEVMEALQLASGPLVNERGLNEWTTSQSAN